MELNNPADALSLLAALIAESYVTYQDVLLELHCIAFHHAVEKLLLDPLMADMADSFRDWIAFPILTTSWRPLGEYHTSSLAEPFLSLDSWGKIIGKNPRDWFSLILDGDAYARWGSTSTPMPPPPESPVLNMLDDDPS